MRSRRRKTVLSIGVAGAVLVALVLAVLPALGAVGDVIPPETTTLNVPPTVFDTGGQSNDCQLFSGEELTQPLTQFRIDTPKSQSYTTTVTTDRDVHDQAVHRADQGQVPGLQGLRRECRVRRRQGRQRHGVVRLRVKQPAIADKGLHATIQSGTTLYNVSNTTFCFQPSASISGRVFNDANGNGVDNAEAGLLRTCNSNPARPRRLTTSSSRTARTPSPTSESARHTGLCGRPRAGSRPLQRAANCTGVASRPSASRGRSERRREQSRLRPPAGGRDQRSCLQRREREQRR